MKFFFTIIFVFMASIANAEPGGPIYFPLYLLLEPPCAEKPEVNISIESVLPEDSKKVYLSFITYTKEPNTCLKYNKIVKELKNEDLIRFLNKGIDELISRDFGTVNAADWEDPFSISFSQFNDCFYKPEEGMDRIRKTIHFIKKLKKHSGSSLAERFENYKNKSLKKNGYSEKKFKCSLLRKVERCRDLIIENAAVNEEVTLKEKSCDYDELIKECKMHANFLYLKSQIDKLSEHNLPFIVYQTKLKTQGAISDESPIIEELLGKKDKPHWLLGRKMLRCRFDISILYLLKFEPPIFRHEIAFSLSPYCGDDRIDDSNWDKESILPFRFERWRERYSKQISEIYIKSLSEDPFLRDQRLRLINDELNNTPVDTTIITQEKCKLDFFIKK